MEPERVNPGNFTIDYILFDNEEFSVSYGTWESGNKCLAMRWNGKDNDPGYPKVFGNPMWFIIADELKFPFIHALIGRPDSIKENILKVLSEII